MSKFLATSSFVIAWLMVMSLLFCTLARNTTWRDETTLLESAAVGSPFKPRSHYNLGCRYKSVGLFHEAIREFTVTLALEPDHAEAMFNLGVVYIDVGEPDKARKEFSRVLQLNPTDRQSRLFLEFLSSMPQ